MESDLIKNRVEESKLITLDIEEHIHAGERVEIDLKQFLFQEMILREKDFRLLVRNHDWSAYSGKNVLISCSVDTLIPSWAYMLIVSKLSDHANQIAVGSSWSDLEKALIDQAIGTLDIESFNGKKVVVKGCGSLEGRDYYYVEISKRLLPRVSSLMYGEPCSTVPIFKSRNK